MKVERKIDYGRKKGQGKWGNARILAQTASVEIAKEIVKNFKDNHPDHRYFITKRLNTHDVFVKGDLINPLN